MGYHGEVRIVCPSCAAAYDVADAALAPGRAVRCARCGVEWAPLPAAEPIETVVARTPPAEPAPAPDAVASAVADERIPLGQAVPDSSPAIEPPRVRFKQRPDRKLLGAWIASVLVLLVLAWGAYAGRAGIMRSWPPSIRLYSAAGLAAPSQNGLSKR